jgi:hypothetical protein
MSTNLLSNAAAPQDGSTDARGALAGLIGALTLALRKYLKRKAARQSELMSRADFCTEMREMSDRVHTDHLSLLDKLDGNHRELLAALERQGTRINALEAGFARLDERTRK